ncbi:hypothetical protein LZ554_007894 [Drepanopeziza brunnea f. sp. 'monogermtubi']|nr:hypothetical protein LZ554_007894 [Drepanopeziza brunnea f. sp. 'monogermtubi']
MEDVKIKPDPENEGSPAGLSEEDIYEEAGDLEFNPDPAFQKLYLARVPKYLWEAWSKLDDDAEIQIGTIRQSATPQGTTRLSMLLTSDLAAHQAIPKEFDLDVTAETVNNTYVFTEKDLPGFKSRSRAKFDPASANMPARLTRPKNDKPITKQPYDPNKRFQPYFRKAIPKKTTLAGRIGHEVNCVAVDNQESQRILAERTLEAMRPKLHTKYIKDEETLGVTFIQPGTMGAQKSFNSFIKTKNPATKERPQMTKTARMPQNELLDRIFECFRRYNYWSLKALRSELKQPEVYLRETLDLIAVLAKSGKFTGNWYLKPANRPENYDAVGDEAAPLDGTVADDSDMADGEDGEDDEDVKFEDV